MLGAVVLGGRGSPDPLSEALVQLLGLLLFAAAVTLGLQPMAVARRDPLWALALGGVVALPLLQLLPLPLAWWAALPGREAASDALRVAGIASGRQPLALLPDEAAAAALALIPASAAAVLVGSAPVAARVRIMALLTAIGGAAALFGLGQYGGSGTAAGFFANRNAQADLLVLTAGLFLLLADRWRDRLAGWPARAAVLAALLLLALGVVATGSRTGMVLMAAVLMLALGAASRAMRRAGVALAIAVAALALGGTALDRSFIRFADESHRADIWADSVVLARELAPVGGGMGGFVPLFQSVERLEQVQPTHANRAHNDWLELAIEGGVPGLLLSAALLAFVGIRVARGWRDRDPDRRLLVRFAGLAAVVLALHSTVDYPLRTLTLLTVAGCAFGGLAFAERRPHEGVGEQGVGGRTHA